MNNVNKLKFISKLNALEKSQLQCLREQSSDNYFLFPNSSHTGEFNDVGSPHGGSTPPQGDLEILLVISSFTNRDKLKLNGTL